MSDIAYKLISKVSRFVVSGFEITEVHSLLVWHIVVSFTMYMVMGIWLKDWVDLTSCHCFTIGFGIMPNLSFTREPLYHFIWIAIMLSLSIINLDWISFRTTIPHGWWADWSLEVLSHWTPESCHDEKGWPMSRLPFTQILNEDV